MARQDLEDAFLTVAEVAGMLKLNQQTVRNWIDQGKLPAIRVGRRVRIKREDFERILEDGATGGAVATGADASPTAEDFWGGEPVGLAEPDPAAPAAADREPPTPDPSAAVRSGPPSPPVAAARRGTAPSGRASAPGR